MSKEYIEREAAIEELKRRDFLPVIVKHAIEAVPAADVAPVVRGHWKKDRDTIKCTVCGFGMFPNRYTFMNGVCVTDNKLPKYCPNCGAKCDL